MKLYAIMHKETKKLLTYLEDIVELECFDTIVKAYDFDEDNVAISTNKEEMEALLKDICYYNKTSYNVDYCKDVVVAKEKGKLEVVEFIANI